MTRPVVRFQTRIRSQSLAFGEAAKATQRASAATLATGAGERIVLGAAAAAVAATTAPRSARRRARCTPSTVPMGSDGAGLAPVRDP
jgi:hypothetical protein